MDTQFLEVEIPQQKHYSAFPFPQVLSPKLPNSSLLNFIDSIKAEKPYLESLLHKSGAILFRGFQVNTASDFNDVVQAFEYEDLPYIEGQAFRNKVIGRVYTANESPLHLHIGFHHELSYLPELPSKLVFFCEVEPAVGGETPLVVSNIVYNKIKERYPDFVQRLEEHGITYSYFLDDEDDLSHLGGRGWKSRFCTDDKNVAEERAAKAGVKLEWIGKRVHIIRGPVPAIRYNKSRDENTWCNSMGVTFQRTEDGSVKTIDSGQTTTFGDGKTMPGEIIHDCLKIFEEESVAFPWQKGDVLLVDNLAVLHGRRPSKPPRRILASMCK